MEKEFFNLDKQEKNKLPILEKGNEYNNSKEIWEKMENEYDRRIMILKKVLKNLEILENLVILEPPVLKRTDFGYNADIDFIFLGNDKQKTELSNELQNTFDIFPHIESYDSKKIEEIKNNSCGFYDLLMKRRGNLPIKESGAKEFSDNFLEESSELEMKARNILSMEEKDVLRKERMKIGKKFIEEIKKHISVLGYNFSGSMMKDMNRFGINSDLDIDILVNPSNKEEQRWDDLIHYLKWKYAEDFGIKIDIGDISLEKAREMVNNNPKFRDFYKEEFGVDVTQEIK